VTGQKGRSLPWSMTRRREAAPELSREQLNRQQLKRSRDTNQRANEQHERSQALNAET
jgi:hypothetical protein